MNDILLKIELKSLKEYILPAVSCLKELSLINGLNEDDTNKLMIVTEEACLNVIQHAYENNINSRFEIIAEKSPGKFIIAIEDKGLPFDFDSEYKDRKKGFGMTIMQEYSDEIKFVNLGRYGKRIEIIKHLNNIQIEKSISEDANDTAEAGMVPTSEEPLNIRLLEKDEIIGLERLLYKVYGYSYSEFIYFPEKVRELMENGILISVIAVASDGEFAGHQGIKKPFSDSVTAEVAMGCVDPKYRGRGLFEKLKTFAFAEAKKKGIIGLFGEAVTIHSYSQKANFAMGGKETGILLGYIKSDISFKKINKNLSARQTAVLFYTRLTNEPEREVYLPETHKEIIRKIYEYSGFQRNIVNTEIEYKSLPEKSNIEVTISVDFNLGILTVKSFGKDFEKSLRVHLRELCFRKTDVVFLDVPLSSPATSYFNEVFNSAGFFFSGVMPEYLNGDLLRYEYLNNIEINPDETVLVTDFGKELFKYVLENYEKKL